MPPIKRLKARGGERRQGLYLHAHDSGSGLCDARLRKNWSRSFSGIRRFLARIHQRSYSRFGLPTVITADEGVRGGKLFRSKQTLIRPWMNAPTSTRCLWSGEPARKSPGLKVVTWITGKPFLLRVQNAHQKSWMLKILCLFSTRQDPQVKRRDAHHGRLPARRRDDT